MSSRVYDCPSCGAAVKFTSSIAVSAICEFCRSVVVRRDANVASLGVMAALPPDLTPLQPGTRGSWNGTAFELIGRLRVAWSEGSWNEWWALFSDQRTGWIAEAQGFYMVTFPAPAGEVPERSSGLRAGGQLTANGQKWWVVDKKNVRCISGQGELPFELPPEWQRTSVDLSGRDGSFATIDYGEQGTSFYVGAYAKYEELAFQKLRRVPGWDAEPEITRQQSATLGCPTCGAAVNLRAAGQAMSAVCGSCESVIDTSDPDLKVIQEADKRRRRLNPLLPLGKRGRLFGIEYEVVGFVARKDSGSTTSHEYLLFNPWHGFDWLVTYRGHWSFVRRVPELGNLDGAVIHYQRRKYTSFARSAAKVDGVLGEFYWRVKRGETATLIDWVCPPYILSKEVYSTFNEFTWSHGEYVPHTVVADAFGIAKPPQPSGIYLNQPNLFEAKWKSLALLFYAFLAVYLVIQGLFVATIVRSPVFAADLGFDRAAPVEISTTRTFTLKGGSQPVWIQVSAPVSNQWAYFEVDMVNAQTNQTYSTALGVEYYYGIDGGESWAEGSSDDSKAIPAVAAGEYFLNIEPDADPNITTMRYRIVVKHGGLFWSNFWTGLLLLLAYPVYLACCYYFFERARWAESGYAHYTSTDE